MKILSTLVGALSLTVVTSAQAVFIGNIQGGTDFPAGAISFADTVVSYAVGGALDNPSDPHKGAFNALGVPDYIGDNSCSTQADCTFVSLGSGGSIVLRFDDNLLTGSDSNALDLWIFEVGPDIEDTFVDISTDGIVWNPVGKVFGSTAGIDIDAFGFGVTDLFGFVRLTDDATEGGVSGSTAGADIDAVGAISTVPATRIPEPHTATLLGLALLGTGARRRARLTPVEVRGHSSS